MSQTLHIFRKDLRRGWPLLLLWAAVVAFWIAPTWRDPLDKEEFLRQPGLEVLLMPMAAMIAAALTVHLDPLVGSREFWMTRPIRPRSLMAAKALFVSAFFVIPPVLIQLAVLIRFGLPPERWAAQLAELALPWSCLLAFAALLGAWTKGLPGFFALLLGLFLAPQLLHDLINQFRGNEIGIHVTSAPLTAVGLAALALTVLQYRTRKRTLGWLIGGAAGLVMIFAPFSLYPESYFGQGLGPKLGDIQMELTPGPGRETFMATRPERPQIFSAELWFRTASIEKPAESFLTISTGEGTIEWRDGRSSSFFLQGAWNFPAAGAPVDGFTLLDESVPTSPWRSLLIFGDEPIESFLGRSGRLDGQAYGLLWKRADTRTLRLETGAEAAHGDYKARIIHIERFPEQFAVHVRAREIGSASRAARSMAPRLFLVNRPRNELIPLSSKPTTVQQTRMGLLGGGELSLREEAWTFDATAAPSSEWLADAEALVVFYDYVGAYDVRVEVPNLAVDPAESPKSL